MFTKSELQWSGHTFHYDVPNAEADAYRKICTPVSRIPESHELSSLPSSQETSTEPAGSVSERRSTTDLRRRGSRSYPTPQGPSRSPPQRTRNSQEGGRIPVGQRLEIYWCVDKVWTDPSQTRLCTLSQIRNDRQLCKKLFDNLQKVQGLRGRILSFKKCTRVDFISVRAGFLLAIP